MRSRSLARAGVALVAVLLFVTANVGPAVCAMTHHSQPVAEHGAGHDHVPAPRPDTGNTLDAAPDAAPACADMSHCSLAGSGMAAAPAALRPVAAHPLTVALAASAGPAVAAFSPPTPPPRA
jgi:hypothetical protein